MKHSQYPIQIELVSVGDELLRGDVVNTNAAWIAESLFQQGFPVGKVSVIGDEVDGLAHHLRQLFNVNQVIIITGGLGPTDDDRTTEALAKALGVPTMVNPEALEVLKRRFSQARYGFTPNNAKQAVFPQGANLIENTVGTAPGIEIEHQGALVFVLPGVPQEMKAMMTLHVIPILLKRLGRPAPVIKTLHIFGMGESQVDYALRDLTEGLSKNKEDGITLHYRTHFPMNSVIVVGHPQDASHQPILAQQVESLVAEVRKRLGRHVFGEDETTLPGAVVQDLRERSLTLSLAESCTGGLCGDLITNVPGSSAVFSLSVVAYANTMKTQLLGVSPHLLEEHGAVSQACVQAMAQGVRELSGASFGLAISGVAGPTGGSPEKPLGLVHFAVASDRQVWHLLRRFSHSRSGTKQLAAYCALAFLRHIVWTDGNPEDPFDGRWAPEATPHG